MYLTQYTYNSNESFMVNDACCYRHYICLCYTNAVVSSIYYSVVSGFWTNLMMSECVMVRVLVTGPVKNALNIYLRPCRKQKYSIYTYALQN